MYDWVELLVESDGCKAAERDARARVVTRSGVSPGVPKEQSWVANHQPVEERAGHTHCHEGQSDVAVLTHAACELQETLAADAQRSLAEGSPHCIEKGVPAA